MTAANITVVVPVGPFAHNRRWLDETLESIWQQTVAPSEVLLIDDMAGLDSEAIADQIDEETQLYHWRAPWHIGVPTALNFGVSLASNERVLFVGSDDRLGPGCIEACEATWQRRKEPLGYYWLDVEYQNDGERQSIACGAAMVTKALWQHTGGFPLEGVIGAPDAALLSIMIAAKGAAGELIRVETATPQYFHRRHTDADTDYRQRHFGGVILPIRDTLTKIWRKPEWGRFA